MAEKLPTLHDLTQAIYRLSLAQMRSTAIMQSVLEQYQGQMNPETREKIERFLKESFEDADKINTQFGEFEW
ncbi:hypothetical protein [Gluconobacter oxydans]|uniref:Uncharacterized protein n=1 Tax=Gluconobacter oxydans NBRC 3293 TaxID=1315969 RepID=A0A829X563_GLUOY|nr:hypothetical protein [Gluconobacter oxydans]GEM17970.1 hypothetical protein NBRC3293_2467 [Gluconobacter oxydans NBRC 3293]